jgi:hypothetical protein
MTCVNLARWNLCGSFSPARVLPGLFLHSNKQGTKAKWLLLHPCALSPTLFPISAPPPMTLLLIKKEPGLIDPLHKNFAWLSRLETAVQDFRNRQK